MRVYKIQKKNTGLFKIGGNGFKFTTVGKIWSMAGYLKTHIGLCLYTSHKNRTQKADRIREKYSDCEVVEYELREVRRIPVDQFYTGGLASDEK